MRFRRLFSPSVLIMTVVWLFLWGDFYPFGIVSGLLVAWLIRWQFPLPPIYWPGRLRPIGFVVLVTRLVWDLTVSSWRVLKLALLRKVELKPGIVRVELFTDVDLYQVQVAEMISLVPGTVVVEVVTSPRRLYLHVVHMDENHDADAIRAMTVRIERQVLEAFGSDEELAAFRAWHGKGRRLPAPQASDTWEVEE